MYMCGNAIMKVPASIWLWFWGVSGFLAFKSRVLLAWNGHSAESCNGTCRHWIWLSKGAEEKAFCCPECRIAVWFSTVNFRGFCSTVVKQFLGKFCLGLYCLTPLHELISSCPVRQSSGRTTTPFSEHHYPSLWKVMRFMKMVMTFFHPPPQRLLGSKELRSLTNDINIYLKAKQLFSFLLPPPCAALGVQHSHCYIPTLQFSVSSWPAVLSSKGWFLLFVSFLGKKTSADALLQNRQEGQLPPFSMMRAGMWWTWKASCSSPKPNHVVNVFQASRRQADPTSRASETL